MKDYIVIADTMRDAHYCFHYMLDLLRGKITYASKLNLTICIDEYRIKFTSEEMYITKHRFGSRAETLNCSYVERLLDTYKVLSGR